MFQTFDLPMDEYVVPCKHSTDKRALSYCTSQKNSELIFVFVSVLRCQMLEVAIQKCCHNMMEICGIQRR